MSVSGTTFGFPVFSSDFPDFTSGFPVFSSGFLVFFYAHTFWKWLAEKTISENRQETAQSSSSQAGASPVEQEPLTEKAGGQHPTIGIAGPPFHFAECHPSALR